MPKLKKVPFEFKNELVNDTNVITLSGTVGMPYPWEEEDETINQKFIESVLSKMQGDILIKLNSPGGDVFEGIAIYNYLKSLDNHITIEVTALAASAASIICMGANKVVMDTGSNFMIHEASTIAWGNKSDIQKTLNALNTIDTSLVDIYVERTGKTDEEITNWLNGETWFTANEAVENGFADEIGNVAVKEEVVEEKSEDAIAKVMAQLVEINDKLAKAESESAGNKVVNEINQETINKPKNILKNLLGGN